MQTYESEGNADIRERGQSTFIRARAMQMYESESESESDADF